MESVNENWVADASKLLVWDPKHEHVVRDIWGHLEYEQHRPVQPDDVVIDAGASIGIFTVKASVQAGKSGVIHAFEPNPENFPLLKHNTEKLQNVKISQKALWSSSGVKTFYINDLNWGGSSLYLLPSAYGNQTFTVETITLDDAVQGIVNFLKVDVEASELEVFKGAKRILTESTPFIAVEIHSLPLYHVVNEYLSSLGYRSLAPNPTYGTVCWAED